MKRLILLTFLVSVVYSCGTTSEDAPSGDVYPVPPTERPNDLVVRYSDGGGMSGDYSSIYISPDSCSYVIGHQGTENILPFKLSTVELDELYKFMLESEFQKIRSIERDEVIYDMGSTSLDISYGRESVGGSDGASNYISDAGSSAFSSICYRVLQIASEKTESHYKTLTIQLDESMRNKGKDFYLSFETASIYFNEVDSTMPDKFEFEIFNGYHEFQCGLLNPDYNYGQGGGTQYYATAFFELELTDSNRILTLSCPDSTIILEGN